MDLLKVYEKDLENIYSLKFVETIIVFGSYAKGEIKPLSDLDICVIVSKKTTKNQKDKIYAYKNEKLDIYVFDDLSLSLQFKILFEGLVYESKLDITELKNQIMNEWFDFRPILNRIYTNKNLLPIM